MEKDIDSLMYRYKLYVCASVCVCVGGGNDMTKEKRESGGVDTVRAREGETERERDKERQMERQKATERQTETER